MEVPELLMTKEAPSLRLLPPDVLLQIFWLNSLPKSSRTDRLILRPKSSPHEAALILLNPHRY